MKITLDVDETTGTITLDDRIVEPILLADIIKDTIEENLLESRLNKLHRKACNGWCEDSVEAYCSVVSGKPLTTDQRDQMIRLVNFITPSQIVNGGDSKDLIERVEATIVHFVGINEIMGV